MRDSMALSREVRRFWTEEPYAATHAPPVVGLTDHEAELGVYPFRQEARVAWARGRALPHLAAVTAYLECVADAAADPGARRRRRRDDALRHAEWLGEAHEDLADLVVAVLVANQCVWGLISQVSRGRQRGRPLMGGTVDQEMASLTSAPNRMAGGRGKKAVRLGPDDEKLVPAARRQVEVIRRLTKGPAPAQALTAAASHERLSELLGLVRAVDEAQWAGRSAAGRLARLTSPEPPPPASRADRPDAADGPHLDPAEAAEQQARERERARERARAQQQARERERAREQRQARDRERALMARITEATESYHVGRAELRALGWADLERQLASGVSSEDCPCPGHCHRPPASPSETHGLLEVMKLASSHERAADGFAARVAALAAAEARMREEVARALGDSKHHLADGGTELVRAQTRLHLAEALSWMDANWEQFDRLLHMKAPALRPLLKAVADRHRHGTPEPPDDQPAPPETSPAVIALDDADTDAQADVDVGADAELAAPTRQVRGGFAKQARMYAIATVGSIVAVVGVVYGAGLGG